MPELFWLFLDYQRPLTPIMMTQWYSVDFFNKVDLKFAPKCNQTNFAEWNRVTAISECLLHNNLDEKYAYGRFGVVMFLAPVIIPGKLGAREDRPWIA